MTEYIKTHAFYLILIVIGVLCARAWLTEHDQRLQAQQTEKVAEAQIKDLQSAIELSKQQAEAAKAVVVKQVAAVKTAPQAVVEIPKLTDAPLNARVVPEDPTRVSVEFLPLVQELGAFKQASIDLGACVEQSKAKDQQLKAKDDIITAYKKPKGFWKRLKQDAEIAAISVGVGVILAGVHL